MGDESKTVTLSQESIGALADEIEARRGKKSPANTNDHNSGRRSAGRNGKNLFLWGAASGVGFALFAPLFSRQARPAFREIVKGGIKAGRYVQKLGSQIKEDVEDLTAEAKADLEKNQTKNQTS
jgi:hypothetical protein